MPPPPPFSTTSSIRSLALSILAACLLFSPILFLFSPPLPRWLRIARLFMLVITPFRSTTMPRKIRAVEMAIVVGSAPSLLLSSLTDTWRLAMRSDGVAAPPPPPPCCPCPPDPPPHECRRQRSSLEHRCGGGWYSTGPWAGGRSDSRTGGPE